MKLKEGEEPDAVIMYVNPVQAMRLIHAYTYDTGEKITADTVAEGAMCSSVGFAVKEGKATVGFPCAGDRILRNTKPRIGFCSPIQLGQGKDDS